MSFHPKNVVGQSVKQPAGQVYISHPSYFIILCCIWIQNSAPQLPDFCIQLYQINLCKIHLKRWETEVQTSPTQCSSMSYDKHHLTRLVHIRQDCTTHEQAIEVALHWFLVFCVSFQFIFILQSIAHLAHQEISFYIIIISLQSQD